MTDVSANAFEKHYSIKEIAETWNLSEQSVRRIFEPRSDVLKISGPTVTGRRRYVTLRVPASVLARVHVERSRGVLHTIMQSRGKRV
jgi:hypothetical protein